MAKLRLKINGEEIEVEAKETALLLDVLREGLELTGTKRGCETSHCGACTVLLDGMAAHSCVVLAARCEGKEISTRRTAMRLLYARDADGGNGAFAS